MCFTLRFAKQLNAGLHVSLLWIQSSSEWSFPGGFSRSPAPGVVCPVLHVLKELHWHSSVWTVTKSMTLQIIMWTGFPVSNTVNEEVFVSNLKMHCISCGIYWNHSYKVLCYVCNYNSYFFWDERTFNLCNYYIINFARTNSNAFHFFSSKCI